MRKYDVDEIDQMRASINTARAWSPGQPRETVEEELRTYMLAGITPAELAERAKAKQAKHTKEVEAQRTVHVADAQRRMEIRAIVQEELQRRAGDKRDFYGNPITTVADVRAQQRRGFFR